MPAIRRAARANGWTFPLLSLLAWTALLSCDPSKGTDAGTDAGRDADAGRADAGVILCEPECSPELSCCPLDARTEGCVNLREDPRHCGACGMDCLATERGDACTRSQCSCGPLTLGCMGTRQSLCCMLPGVMPYCANLDQDLGDCGECGQACDPARADRCDGGECRCGDGRAACDGTPESTCCISGVDVDCVDTRTDRFHCGRCSNLCQGIEQCAFGTCTRGDACPSGCDANEICCSGRCCTRAACVAGTCGGVDAGNADAGT